MIDKCFEIHGILVYVYFVILLYDVLDGSCLLDANSRIMFYHLTP